MKQIDIFPWNKSFEVGIELIDTQHQKLVSIINNLASQFSFHTQEIDLGTIFDELIDYTHYHFESEEAIWSEYFNGNESEAKHRKSHNDFIEMLKDLIAEQQNKPIEEVAENTLHVLVQWLVSHILETDRMMAYCVIALKEGKSDDEAKAIAKERMSGQTREVINIVISIYDTLSNNTLKLMRVLEQQRKTQISLLRAKDEAEKANVAKSRFLANMSHEIRTPMTGILGFIEHLEKEETDPERLKQFQVIKNSGQNLLAVLNDILDLSKIESDKLDIEATPCALNDLIEGALDIFTTLASSRNITVQSMRGENMPACFMGDEIRIKQILYNLVSNAVKFSHEGGTVTFQIYYDTEQSLLHFAVVDTGIGIAKENLKKIFDAFSQEDISTTRRFGGTGLGLTISMQLLRLMGSELHVQSTLGEGSKFYFDLPVTLCSSADLKKHQEPHRDVDISKLSKLHVLIAEDNKTNQMLLSLILDDFHVTYDLVENGAEAVMHLKTKRYDLIFMDENMPVMNGIEATQHIREYERNGSHAATPIVAVTANSLVGDRQKFLDAGMDEYVSKPYSEEDILKMLLKYC